MVKMVARLYPSNVDPVSIEQLYLGEIPDSVGKPFVYSNFVTSLDGRIALPRADRDSGGVPAAIANPDDWHLFQQLAAQADVLITSARYFRQSAVGESQDWLPLGPEPAFDSLRAWRLQNMDPDQPSIAILSGSLDIPEVTLERYLERGVHILTTESAPQKHVTRLESAGARIHRLGQGNRVAGDDITRTLFELGFVRQYAIGGPEVMHSLTSARVLDRLYITCSFHILGGETFDSIIRGPQLDPAAHCQLRSLYLLEQQLFAAFDLE